MAEKKKDKLIRTRFAKDSTAEDIVSGIDKLQDNWAKEYPDRAHKLYPTVYSETGERIQKDKPKKDE